MTVSAVEKAEGWTVDGSTFGARLALIRHRMGWNMKEAAIACGIAPASWTNWEQAGMLPRRYVQTCKQIAGRTGCDLMWLVDMDSADGRIRTSAYGPRVLDPGTHRKTTPPVAPTRRRPTISARYAA